MDQELQTIIVGAAASLLSALVGYVLIRIETYIKRKTGVEIDAYHREALHSALDTGARIAFNKLTQGNKNGDALDSALDGALRERMKSIVKDYVERSVPDAIKHFTPTDSVTDDLVTAAIEKLVEKMKK